MAAFIPKMDPNAMPPNPFAAFAPPQPPPPTSPSLGFQAWASDPQNAQKVAHTMTAPNAPLQPNAGQPAQPAPPPVDNAKLQSDMAELTRLQQTGAGVNQVKNPFLRTLGKIGDVAETMLAPGFALATPGTTLHNRLLQKQASQRVQSDQDQLTNLLNQQKTQQDIQMAPQELAIKQQAASLKGLQAQGTFAQHGLKVQQNEDGSTSIVPDEDSPVFKEQQSKTELANAQIEVAKSNKELKDAQAAFKQAQNDPNSPIFRQTAERLATARANAAAASTRAEAYMGRYLQSAFNTDLKGNVLPGATQIADESGRETVVGTGNASQAAKSQANVAQFNDIEGATNNIEKAATTLVNKGGKLNDPRVAAAIADPKTTAGQWAQGEFATSGLTPEQRDYVVQVKAYKENLQSLRKSAGGGVSDSQVDRLMSLAPGANTPDLDYLKRQTEQIRQMRGRLATGVTTAAGGVKVAGRNNPMQPPTATYKQTASGPGGKIGSNDGGNTWFDVKTGKKVQ